MTLPLIELNSVSVRFGGNVAVSDVSLNAWSGRITGLIGPNGAGKTTTFNVMTGLQSITGGKVKWSGRDITHLPAHERARLGLARTFQRLELFDSMTVAENVLLAAEVRRQTSTSNREPLVSGIEADSEPADEVAAILQQLRIESLAATRAGDLATGQARLVELGRALASRPRLLLMDEPASGLSQPETESFAEVLEDLALCGAGIVIVEHDVGLVMRLCDEIYVLDLGRVLACGQPDEIQADERVIEAYLGAAV